MRAYGHPAGDALLCQVAKLLRSTVRSGDLASRIGGEEFVAICLDTDAQGTMQLAERLRAAVEAQALWLAGIEHPLRCTVTIGLSPPFQDAKALDEAMRQADEALYRGKAAGRNRVEVAQ